MAAETPQLTTKTSFTIPSFLQAMIISAMFYATLTLIIASTIPSPSPVGRLVGFWGGTTSSTWVLFLFGSFTTDPVYPYRVALWVMYALQIILGAGMVPEQYWAQVDPCYLSNIPVIIPLVAILALLGHVIDRLYLMASKQSQTGEDDVNILPILRGWMTYILAFYHGNSSPQTPPGTSTERFSMPRLDAEESGGNFQSWLFRMVERMYRHQMLQRKESETDLLLSDMEVV